ncbi:MAG: hypothetical protein ACI9JN_002150 [Bacteroidia bacterium]
MYKKADAYLLQNHPRLWVLGIHIFIPITVLLWLILFIIGILRINEPWRDIYSVEDGFEQIAVGMILPVMLLVILFIIRQVKYNSKRVHQKLPFKGRFVVFLSFWIVLFLLSSLPMATYFGSWFAPGLNHDKDEFKSDREIIESNYTHFNLKGCGTIQNTEGANDYEQIEGLKSLDSENCLYKLDDTGDSIIMEKHQQDYSNYYARETVKISRQQALDQIDLFLQVAKKYKAKFKLEDSRQILNQNLNPETITWEMGDEGTHYTHIENKEVFDRSISMNHQFRNNRNVFTFFNWKFWRYYALLSFSFAFLLIILCSVDRAEFGWAMLACALLPTVYGIILGLLSLINVMDSEGGARFLLILFVIISGFLAFASKYKPVLKRAFAISLNIFLPLVLPVIFLDDHFDEDLYVVSVFALGLVLTYLFSFYYKIQYLHPRKT